MSSINTSGQPGLPSVTIGAPGYPVPKLRSDLVAVRNDARTGRTGWLYVHPSDTSVLAQMHNDSLPMARDRFRQGGWLYNSPWSMTNEERMALSSLDAAIDGAAQTRP